MAPLFKTALLRTFGFLLWAFFSAWLFYVVEYTEKDNQGEKYQLLHSLYVSMTSKYNMTIEEFNNFSSIAYEALTEPKPQWTYSVSVNFVFQAFTTIGYGYITPQTAAGQMLCIFVCLLGIPITLLALKSVGEVIAKLVNTLISQIEKKCFKRAQPKQVETKSAAVLFVLMVFLIAANGLLMMHTQDWTFVEGVYFWFVTLTTIGFGDYVPEKQAKSQLPIYITEQHANKAMKTSFKIFSGIFITTYAVIGLCVVSSVLNSIMAAMEKSKCHPPCPGCVPRKTRDEANSAEQYCTPKRRENNKENLELYSVTEL